MTIEKNREGETLTLSPAGRLDTTTAPQLEAVVLGELGGVTKLIFDFSGLEYISSAGLRVLLEAQKTMNRQGSMTVRGVGASVMEVLEVTGFGGILNIE